MHNNYSNHIDHPSIYRFFGTLEPYRQTGVMNMCVCLCVCWSVPFTIHVFGGISYFDMALDSDVCCIFFFREGACEDEFRLGLCKTSCVCERKMVTPKYICLYKRPFAQYVCIIQNVWQFWNTNINSHTRRIYGARPKIARGFRCK